VTGTSGSPWRTEFGFDGTSRHQLEDELITFLGPRAERWTFAARAAGPSFASPKGRRSRTLSRVSAAACSRRTQLASLRAEVQRARFGSR
jgi:hypothetical protein